jgi:hypothetical protein
MTVKNEKKKNVIIGGCFNSEFVSMWKKYCELRKGEVEAFRNLPSQEILGEAMMLLMETRPAKTSQKK